MLVNNAGISPSLAPPSAEAGIEEFRRTYETNVFGVVAVTNAFLPALRRSPHPRIVNVSSGTASLTWSTSPNPQFTPGGGAAASYRSSKAALNALTVLYAPLPDGAADPPPAPPSQAVRAGDAAAATRASGMVCRRTAMLNSPVFCLTCAERTSIPRPTPAAHLEHGPRRAEVAPTGFTVDVSIR